MAKILGRRDLVLFTVSAIVLLDTLAASASIGPSSLFWWLFLAAVFLVPIGLITAELGAAYPTDGGIYVWLRRAFGHQWAARTIWAYWVNTALWLPAIFILFAGVSSRLFGVEMSLGFQIGLGIGLAWLTAALDILGLKIGKWAPNLGAIFKFLIFLALILAGLQYGFVNGFANDLSLSALAPRWGEGVQYIPAIIYGMLGFELVSSAGDEIKAPARNVPAAIFISGVFVVALYFFATLGILAAIPAEDLDIVDGLIDTLSLLFSGIPGGEMIVMALGIGALFTFFSNGATWAMGCNRTTAEAASEGQLPRVFAIRHPNHRGPVGAAMMMGVVCTLALVLYGKLAQSNEDLFWTLFSFSAVIFMLPYLGLSLAFLRLRLIDPETPRPFKAPGGMAGTILLTALSVGILLATIVLFLYVPEEGVQWPTVFGVGVVLIVGEVLIRFGDSVPRSNTHVDDEAS